MRYLPSFCRDRSKETEIQKLAEQAPFSLLEQVPLSIQRQSLFAARR
jgi:hypothetical protein